MARENTIIGGKYEILRKIGEGGMSRVYLAMDMTLNKQWAIKEIKKKGSDKSNEIVVNSLIAEANLMKDFEHPALPRIVDIIDDGETLFVVMDYIEGEPLSQIIAEYGPQPQELVVEWGMQLCDVLDYLHTRNPPIVYRDMKPSNVMLMPSGNVKLIDFGIAREFKRTSVADTTALGTKGYAAPEQFGGLGQTDARTDIYCLGATLYHLVTGRSPAEPPYEIKPITQINPALSSGLEKIILKCTQPDPNLRYQSCAELLYALEHYEQEDDAFIAKKKRQVRAFGIFAGVGVACLLLSALFFTLRTSTIENSFGTKMSLAQNSEASDAAAAEGYYIEAAGIKPGDPAPYLGLISCYEADGEFSTDEKEQFDKAFTANQNTLKKDSGYANLMYEIGKMYWYYYSYGETVNTDGTMNDNQVTRANEAKNYFAEAAGDTSFDRHSMAITYRDISTFYSERAGMVLTDEDSGSYAPYWDDLEELSSMMRSGDVGEKVSLDSYALILNSIESYAYKFAGDGITKDQMRSLYKEAAAALSALSVSDENAATKTAIEARESNVARAIEMVQE